MAKINKAKMNDKKVKLQQKHDDEINGKVFSSHQSGSSEHAFQKFKKDFDRVINNMKQEEEDWDEGLNIPFAATGSILTTLGFLPLKMQEESEDYKLC